jgi:hypothetical protein
VCDNAVGQCVECVGDPDCRPDEHCLANSCSPSCDSDNDCRAFRLLCDRERAACVECVDSSDCPQERYCSAGTCSPDACSADDDACTMDDKARMTCSADGSGLIEEPCGPGKRCELGADGATCERLPCWPQVMLMLDASGSMCADYGGVSRWEALRSALLDPDDGLLRSYEAALDIGAAIFAGSPANPFVDISTPAIPIPPTNCDQTAAPAPMHCPELVLVSPARDNAGAIDAAAPSINFNGMSPTHKAVTAVLDPLLADANADARATYLILITDGAPQDICMGGAGGDAGESLLVDAIDRAAAAGIVTSVVNLETGSPQLQAYLDMVAVHGDPGNAGAHALPTNDLEQLRQALEPLFERAMTCE